MGVFLLEGKVMGGDKLWQCACPEIGTLDACLLVSATSGACCENDMHSAAVPAACVVRAQMSTGL